MVVNHYVDLLTILINGEKGTFKWLSEIEHICLPYYRGKIKMEKHILLNLDNVR